MNLTKIASASLIAATMLSSFATQVMAADEMSQSQSQELEVTCEVGAYGQATNCRARGTQSQSQSMSLDRTRVVYVNGRVVPVHQVVDTALDQRTTLAIGLGFMAVIALAFLSYKLRAK